MKTSFKASLIALAIASFPMGGQAASLGQINVFSGLGQPLRAEIGVSATPQELQSLSARIASVDAFRAANLPYSSAASAVRVSLDTRSARPVIRLSSVRPINDPFMELLVELNWASGQLSREYTFLLDPVDLSAPKPVAARLDRPGVAAQAVPAVQAAREPARAVSPPRAVDRYTVRRGDTLRSIAASTAPEGASLDQMLVALFRANPGAFDGANINRLRAGAVLSVPSVERVQAIDAVEARREVVAQAADFEAYRRRLATSVASRPVAPDAAAEQASGGRVVPKIEEARPTADGGDKVRVSRSEKMGEGDAGTRLQALEEELATREKALQDANQRLAQLEQSIRDLQKLLEVRSASLAQAQQQAGGAPVAAPAPAVQPPAQVTPTAGSETAPVAAASTEKAQEPAAAPASPAAPVASEPVKPATAEATPKTEPMAAPKKVRPAPPPPEEPSFLESLMNDPTMLAAGGGVAALLLALVGFKLRQRRAASGPVRADGDSGGETPPAGGRAVFGETGGQSVDTGASMLMTDFSQSGLSAIDTDEGVDPVAEADVYMAYGRDAQAEEILLDAMKVDPDRVAIYLKLLEIYAQRKSAKQFETVATDLYARTGGLGADWERAAAMGRKLDPENPLYGARSAVADPDLPAPVTEVPLAVSASLAAGAIGAAAQAAASNALSDEPVSTSDEAAPESLAALDFTASLPSAEPSHSQLKDTWTRPGELAQFSDGAEGEPGPSADPTLAVEQPDLPASLEVIDFDLGLEEPDHQAPAADSVDLDAQPAVAQPVSEGLTFDLDVGELDLGSTSGPSVSPDEPTPSEDGMSETVLEDIRASATGGLDFNLAGFDEDFATATAPDLNATMMEMPAADFEPETTALGVDFDVPEDASNIVSSEVLDMQATVIAPDAPALDADATALDLDFDLPDLDLGMEVGASDAGVAVVPEHDLSAVPRADVPAGEAKTTFDEGLLDFDFDLEQPVAASDVAPSLDLTSIDLSLDGLDEAHAEGAAGNLSSEVAEPSGDFAGNHDEIETKIELARAYEEMGDKEGALELLDEVLREGGAPQQAIAREIIARLG